MYDLGTVKRRISEKGVDTFISEISSENFSETIKKDLSDCNVFGVNIGPKLSDRT